MKKNRYITYLIILSLAYGALFLTLNVLKSRAFFSFEWEDEAMENQVFYNIAASFYPHQTMDISRYFFGHFTPIYFLAALFYKIYPHICTFYFLISFLYGFSSIIVYLLAKDILENETTAFIVSLSYLLYPPLHYVNIGSLDGNTFFLPLLFLAFYFFYKRRFLPYVTVMVLSCMCKENSSLIIFLLGVYILIKKYPKKWWVTTLLFSFGYLLMVINLVPLFEFAYPRDSGPAGGQFQYLDLQSIKDVFMFVTVHNEKFIRLLGEPSRWRAFFLFLWPVIFLPLLSCEFYLALPLIGQILLCPQYTNDASYYFAPIIPLAFIGLIFFLRRLGPFAKRFAVLILITSLASNFTPNLLGKSPAERMKEDGELIFDKRFLDVKNIFDKRLYIMDDEDRLAWEFIAMIPKEVSVTASGDLLTPLSTRSEVYLFGMNEPHAQHSEYGPQDYYPAYESDYILIHTKNIYSGIGGDYPFADKELVEEIIKEKLLKGGKYSIIRQEGNFILLKKRN